jgi:hypothetical protein
LPENYKGGSGVEKLMYVLTLRSKANIETAVG